jgi:hypothetical protein
LFSDTAVVSSRQNSEDGEPAVIENETEEDDDDDDDDDDDVDEEDFFTQVLGFATGTSSSKKSKKVGKGIYLICMTPMSSISSRVDYNSSKF